MKTITTESTIFFDVDQTLVLWGKIKKKHKVVAITCPHSGEQYYLRPHKGHIKILKDRKSRGSFITVWSAGGFAWAEAVVKALDLTQHVDLIMSKPHAYVDDKKAEEFMGERIYLGIDDSYGQ